MKTVILALALSLLVSPAMADTPVAKSDASASVLASSPAVPGDQIIQVKLADYGPFWGKYRSLASGMREYCGTESSFCEVYCPDHDGMGGKKTCRVVYGCGEHVTKSAQALSGELIVMDCRKSAPGLKPAS